MKRKPLLKRNAISTSSISHSKYPYHKSHIPFKVTINDANHGEVDLNFNEVDLNDDDIIGVQGAGSRTLHLGEVQEH